MRPRETSIRSGKIRRTGRNVEIPYVLARSGRVFVVLRGPVPSCTFVSRFSVRGQRGPNVLRFDGTVGRERLQSGTYLIGLRTAASSVRWKLLTVSRDAVRPVRRSAAPIVRACAEPTALAVLVSSEISGTPGKRREALSPNASAAPQPRPSVLPFVGVEEAIGELPTAAGVLLVLLLLSSVAGITAIVVRFLRAS
jgi:hypothetical protein